MINVGSEIDIEGTRWEVAGILGDYVELKLVSVGESDVSMTDSRRITSLDLILSYSQISESINLRDTFEGTLTRYIN